MIYGTCTTVTTVLASQLLLSSQLLLYDYSTRSTVIDNNHDGQDFHPELLILPHTDADATDIPSLRIFRKTTHSIHITEIVVLVVRLILETGFGASRGIGDRPVLGVSSLVAELQVYSQADSHGDLDADWGQRVDDRYQIIRTESKQDAERLAVSRRIA